MDRVWNSDRRPLTASFRTDEAPHSYIAVTDGSLEDRETAAAAARLAAILCTELVQEGGVNKTAPMESFCGAMYRFMSTKTAGLQQTFSMLTFIRDRYSPLIPRRHQKVLKEPSRSISQITQGSVCPSPPQWLAAFLRKIQNQINSVQNGLLEDGIKDNARRFCGRKESQRPIPERDQGEQMTAGEQLPA
ncbi:uncharacterized protein ASPGLDRAFT_25456 [Aspergillus glaucus CBS 516.65]|uniref:Uncharacterized protein n=1 Tax=Aspergillus glaucus CBS 516.65 TaxID=1160497 RepID=A0A1L9VLP0_ASPGL|nr:hypothetical protein ASPGLDRAFT_25456 [Aspergillus glaucus CBS 516.65]OJJ84804.1 hypothetical protein ASPGLDRAFT_25456 [Aspergillus glaucus CBS 516.65]